MSHESDIPDLVFHNAHVITMDPRMPRADAVAVEEGRITAVGDRDSFRSMTNRKVRIIDCGGRTLLPGFIDAHCHLRAYAETFATMELTPEKKVSSILDIQSRIRERASETPAGTWIRGQGYHEFDLMEKRHPTRWDLDEASPRHPVKISHRTGHAHVLNSPALKLVGLSRYSPEPGGGLMERDLATGDLTGVLYQMGDFLAKRIPRLSDHEMEQGLVQANRSLLSLGITSLYDASSRNSLERWLKMAQWKEKKVLIPRVGMFFSPSVSERILNLSSACDESDVRPLGIKIVLDESTGEIYPPQEELNRMVLEAQRLGFQVAIHAVENAAIESACTALEKALASFHKNNHRHRLEHCFLCKKAQAARIAGLGFFVVTQPGFIYRNGDRYLATVSPEEQEFLYPIRSLIETGVPVAAGSDCPVGPADPLLGIYAAVTRRTRQGALVCGREGISLGESLSLYTSRASESAFEEHFKGSLTPGKLADLVLLSRRLQEGEMEGLKDTCVEATVIGGQIVWERSA